MKYRLLIFFLIFFPRYFFFSQEKDSLILGEDYDYTTTDKGNTVETDSLLTDQYHTKNPLYIKKIDSTFKKKYKDPDFDYRPDIPKESFWSKFARWLKDLFGITNVTGIASFLFALFKIIAILIIGVLLYFVVKYFLNGEGKWRFKKKVKNVIKEQESVIENIHELDFSTLISEKEKKGDYRSAVRYQFLYLLKKMTDQKLIDWNPEKTNGDYLYELSGKPIQKDFKDLAYVYEYVWYGEFPIDSDRYQYFKRLFNQAQQGV